ncbi:hypothetical protein RhiirA1_463055 [Rhizophagus irregularis]|uniref:Crinkler effector protein N-terminal domain-containing protein n=1 Tax=Rhizophagus irregularis TaxID=588596 RepID=A0A2N0RL05_9GLOM|nr:hypothetical protein RhiirA1_463055 [Rhizophagus irregularis]
MSNYSSLSRILSPFAVPGVDVPIEKFSFGHLKKQILPNNNEANKLRLWKFETPFKKYNEKLKILNENFHNDTDLEQELGEDLSPGELIRTIFPVGYVFSPNHIHIIVQPPSSPATTAGVSRGITQGTPGEPNSIFKEFLESRHGQFLKTYIEKNDSLPLFDSEILKTPVPTLKGRPSLLLYNLPGGDHQPITQVTKIQSAMKKAKNNLLVLLGTSGCGKTRTCYELLCCNWGLYFVALRKGNGGSCDIESIEGYLRLNNMITDDFESNRQHADHIVRCLILSRLLILNECIKKSTFKPQRWFLLQTYQNIFGGMYKYNDDLFCALMLKLVNCTQVSLEQCIDNLYQKILELNGTTVFPIIVDEAQSLQMVLYGKYRSRYNEIDKRSLLSPIVQTLKRPTPSFTNHCVIPCGTGLGLLSLDEVFASTGIAKPDLDIDKFTDFGKWRDIAHVKEYISDLLELKVTEENIENIYSHFRGRFRPIVTCIERIIMGNLIDDVVEKLWTELTTNSNSEQSMYRQLSNISTMERPNFVSSVNNLDLCLCITLAYYYSGGPFLFTNFKQMKIIEYGFGYLQKVKPPTITQLKPIFKDKVNERVLRTSSVDLSLLSSSSENEDILVAYVDEPFALTSAYNFFKDKDCLPRRILDIMSMVNNPSSCGFLWEKYLPEEFERIFNGQNNIEDLQIFFTNIPDNFKGSPKIVKSSNIFTPRVANSTTGYTLDKFFSEPSESRPTFYFPENLCGPDLIFFVEFENNIRVPVFVQMKLRYSVSVIEEVLSTLHPKMFYRNINGKLVSEKTNKPVIEKITKLCEENGSIGILVAYPADIFNKFNLVTNMSYDYDLRESTKNQFNVTQQMKEQLIGLIDKRNASKVFQGDHMQFLKALKSTAEKDEEEKSVEKRGEGSKSRKRRDEEEKADEKRGEGSKSRKRRKSTKVLNLHKKLFVCFNS